MAPRQVATVILVDRRGWLLLQERDEHAPLAPNKWGLVGGHVEPAEEFESAVYRELEEETGVRLPSELTLWFDGRFQELGDDVPARFQVWTALTTLTDRDIVVGEGRQIVFIEPRQALALDLAESAAHFVSLFLRSPLYARMISGQGADWTV